ncbi:MAG: hypothetical protein ACE5KM_06970 [Planctomycetaceae bacterium]
MAAFARQQRNAVRDNPRGSCFAAATVTGVLAVLWMLGRQGYVALAAFETRSGAASHVRRIETARLDELHANPSPVKSETQYVVARVVEPKSRASVEPPVGPEPAAELPKPETAGPRSPFDGGTASPFAVEPKPFAERKPSNAPAVTHRPVAAKKPGPDSRFLLFSRDASSPPQPNATGAGRIETQPRFTPVEERAIPKGLKKKTLVSASPKAIVTVPRLELEVVRIPRHNGGRFLVTGVSGANPATRSDGPSASDDGHAVSRWSSIRTVAQTVTLSSSANARWQVAAPKLVVAMRSQTVSDDQVRIEFRVTNAGNAVAENVRLHVDLPARLRYPVGRKLLHRVGRLDAGGTHTARLTATIARSGRAPVVARVLDGTTPASLGQAPAVGEDRR